MGYQLNVIREEKRSDSCPFVLIRGSIGLGWGRGEEEFSAAKRRRDDKN